MNTRKDLKKQNIFRENIRQTNTVEQPRVGHCEFWHHRRRRSLDLGHEIEYEQPKKPKNRNRSTNSS